MPLLPLVHFPDIGSYIGVHNALTRNKDEIQDDLVDSVQALDSDYARVTILPNYISNVVSAVNSIEAGEDNIVSAVTDYFNNIIASELPSAETTVSGVITDFFAAMVTASETFQDGGFFDTYFVEKFNRTDVPTAPSGSHTVDDSLAS